jgi:hypothetical protein
MANLQGRELPRLRGFARIRLPSDRFIILRQTFVQREEVGKCEDSYVT